MATVAARLRYGTVLYHLAAPGLTAEGFSLSSRRCGKATQGNELDGNGRRWHTDSLEVSVDNGMA